MSFHPISLSDKYALDKTRAYLTGIEALVRLPILQHQRDVDRGLRTAGFISGYRGSPLGGLDQSLWAAQRYLDQHDIHFVPGINEDLAATAVRGSQEVGLFPGAKYDGVFGMWYGKGPGVDRSMDAIRHANAVGTAKYGGVLAVAGDDHAAKSSSLPHQSEHMFIGASIPVLAPANVQEVLDLGIYGWELSRYCGCWVALKAITENMDSAISAEIDPRRVDIRYPSDFKMPDDGVHIRLPDNPLAQEKRLNKYKIYAAREFARVNELNRVVLNSPKPRLGIACSGKSYLDVMQALEDLGINDALAAQIGLRVFKVGMPWPLEPVASHRFASGLEEILVVEEKRSILEDQLTGQLYNWPVDRRPRVIGEFDETGADLLPNLSELTPAMIARAIAARIGQFFHSEEIERRLAFYQQKEQSIASHRNKINRTPHYCSGCPHNSSTVLPEGSIALGGIGCHYMATFMPSRPAKTFTQMGGEGVTWVGQAAFTDNPHVFQNLGDGTYFHSGLLAIRQSIAAGVNITYKILYNDAVAMTGGQPVDGQLSVEKVVLQLQGEGVERIAVVSDEPGQYRLQENSGVSLDHRDRLMSIQRELKEIKGTTVLIYAQACAAEKRRRRKKGLLSDPDRKVFINQELCEGCGDCGRKSNCLSVHPEETELGRKRQIDQSACNKDYSCVNGFCPSFVSVLGAKRRLPTIPPLSAMPAPAEPSLPPLSRPWNIVVAGIGGTGVLTLASVLAMAAHIEGKGCATMNQTGLAQKFGPVVSHLRVAAKQSDIYAVRIPAGDADLLLGLDLVVACSDEALAKLNIQRSVAIVNEHASPTAEFVYNNEADFPAGEMKKILIGELGRHNVDFLNASTLTEALFAHSAATNFFMLGVAYQKGFIPVSSAAIFQAIDLNGVAVEANREAFSWGRLMVDSPESIHRVAGIKPAWQPLTSLEDILRYRYLRLRDYQNQEYADCYRQSISSLVQAEETLGEDYAQDRRLSIAGAKALYQAMAYKDEYEVARLLSNASFQDHLNASFEAGYRLQLHLAPPLLSRINPDTGEPRKWRFPGFVLPVMSLLASLKGLRGTRWDIFAYTAERRDERKLMLQMLGDISQLSGALSIKNYQSACDLFHAAKEVRGYGHIKRAKMQEYQQLREKYLAQFRGDIVQICPVEHAA